MIDVLECVQEVAIRREQEFLARYSGQLPLLVTTEEVGSFLGVCDRTIRRYYQREGLKVVRLPGNQIRFKIQDVWEFVNARCEQL